MLFVYLFKTVTYRYISNIINLYNRNKYVPRRICIYYLYFIAMVRLLKLPITNSYRKKKMNKSKEIFPKVSSKY